MINDIKNSINKILNERLTSPFYGTFILAWLVWNWRILYLSFFVSEDKIETDKISYIIEKFSDLKYIVFLPLISTIILITLIPFITNRAYWISLLYNQWKVNKRNEVQKKDLLTIEQSLNLREQIKSQEKRFEELLEDKNTELKQLRLQIAEFSNKPNSVSTPTASKSELSLKGLQNLVNKIMDNTILSKGLDEVNYYIQGGYSGLKDSDNITTDIISFFESNDIIENKGKGMYGLTENGKKVNRTITSRKFK